MSGSSACAALHAHHAQLLSLQAQFAMPQSTGIPCGTGWQPAIGAQPVYCSQPLQAPHRKLKDNHELY